MMKFIAPQWVESLARNLEAKYRAEVGNINLLDLWIKFWLDDSSEAYEFFEDIGAEGIEIKAWLYTKGNEEFEQDLLDEFATVV
jgi:hypothetical protein